MSRIISPYVPGIYNSKAVARKNVLAYVSYKLDLLEAEVGRGRHWTPHRREQALAAEAVVNEAVAGGTFPEEHRSIMAYRSRLAVLLAKPVVTRETFQGAP